MSCITKKISNILGLKKHNKTIRKFKKRTFRRPSRMLRLNKFKRSRRSRSRSKRRRRRK